MKIKLSSKETWELAIKIVNMSPEQRIKYFEYEKVEDIFNKLSLYSIAYKIEPYEKKRPPILKDWETYLNFSQYECREAFLNELKSKHGLRHMGNLTNDTYNVSIWVTRLNNVQIHILNKDTLQDNSDNPILLCKFEELPKNEKDFWSIILDKAKQYIKENKQELEEETKEIQ